MATTSSFKQYQRGSRVQTTEENFESGMSYTTAPINEGYFKEFVNYNMKDSGESLVPRNGLQAKHLCLFPYDTNKRTYANVTQTLSECMTKHLKGKMYDQVILGTPGSSKLSGANLYLGSCSVLTIDDAVTEETPDVSGIERKAIRCTDMTTNVVFRRPVNAEIHGMPINNPNAIAQQVGTFAFNNDYYTFRFANTTRGDLYRSDFKENTETYIWNTVPTFSISPKEAVMWGYNMLSSSPYTFSDSTITGTIQLEGILPYNTSGLLQMSPKLNKTLKFRCYYKAPAGRTYKVKWEWREASSSDWNTIEEKDWNTTDTPQLSVEFAPPVHNLLLKVTASYNSAIEKVLTVSLNLDPEEQGSTANIEPKSYNLSKCSGMTYWKNRLVFYGAAEDPTIMFVGDVNNPGYVPYPNNAHVFDEPIMHITPFLDDMLVFTSSQLHLVSLSEDGLGYTVKCIQGNLHISEWDKHLILVVKNMAFFKSGNYYYMVVPKASSLTGELTIAPVAKPIYNYLDNFSVNVANTLDTLYNYTAPVELTHYYNFLDFEDIHNMYIFKTVEGFNLHFDLLYNTMSRSWRIHIYESQNVLYPYKQDATKNGTLASICKLRYNTTMVPSIQIMQYATNDVQDFYVMNEIVCSSGTAPDVVAPFHAQRKFKNYQMFDTGYREHGSDFKRRYREMQIKLNNTSQRSLYFYTGFSIDGDDRKTPYSYVTQQQTDQTADDYGVITLQRVYNDPHLVYGATELAETEQDEDKWMLNYSGFPEMLLWKVRIPVSGKGYAPRTKLISYNENPYEILNISWVSRLLYSR